MFRIIHILGFVIASSSSAEVIMDPEKPLESKAKSVVTPFLGDIKSHAGFFDVSSRGVDSKLFFWFFPHRDPKVPLIVWIQGQPGLSSMYSLFEEHGPYEVDEDMNLKLRKDALTNTYHVLYLDPEVYCGYSHTNGSDSMFKPIDHLPKQIQDALISFLRVFDEYWDNDLYIAGASSNSGIISALAYDLRFYGITSEKKPNLKGLIIGGGVFNVHQSLHYVRTLYWNGIIDHGSLYLELKRKYAIILRYLKHFHPAKAMEEIGSMLYMIKEQGYYTIYDLRDPSSLCDCPGLKYAQRPEIKEALHIGEHPFKTDYLPIVANFLIQDRNLYTELFANYRTLLYHGQFDLLSQYPQAEEFVTSTSWSGVKDYYDSSKANWFHDGELLGYWIQVGNLTHAMIRNAGHFVGKTQPQALHLLFDNFIENKFNSTVY